MKGKFFFVVEKTPDPVFSLAEHFIAELIWVFTGGDIHDCGPLQRGLEEGWAEQMSDN